MIDVKLSITFVNPNSGESYTQSYTIPTIVVKGGKRRIANANKHATQGLADRIGSYPREIEDMVVRTVVVHDVPHYLNQIKVANKNIAELPWKSWPNSWDKITIQDKEVPNELLEFLLEKGIKVLQILGCKMLPPKVPNPKFTHPLKLKSVYIGGECIIGYDGLMTNVLKTHPMERIELDYSEKFISGEKFSEFIASLPQTGSQLKSLVLPATFELNHESLEYIVKSCVNLEELAIPESDLIKSDLSLLRPVWSAIQKHFLILISFSLLFNLKHFKTSIYIDHVGLKENNAFQEPSISDTSNAEGLNEPPTETQI